jgi:cobaltochelatase CobS
MYKYILIPKDKFTQQLWTFILQDVIKNRLEGDEGHFVIDYNYSGSPLYLSLSANDSNWSATSNDLKGQPFFNSNSNLPYINDKLSEITLYAIRITTALEGHLLNLIEGDNDIIEIDYPIPLSKYSSTSIYSNYELADKISPKAKDINVDDIRNDIIANMLNKPITNWINANIQNVNIEEKIDEAVNNYLEEIKKPTIIKQFKIKNKVLDNLYHKQFGQIMELVQLKEPLFIYGHAGSGKTRICIDVANALNLEFRSISVNEQSTKTDFLGYFDAHSNLIRTPFRHIYENGGVFILDEIDAGNPNVLTVLNSALSNGIMAFPDGMIKRHEDFICICTANTTGDKADIKYVGRNILDSATLDRFIRLEVDYDRDLENALISKKTQKLRDRLLSIISDLETNSEDHLLSSRTVFQLDKLLGIKINPRDAVKLATNFGEHILDRI